MNEAITPKKLANEGKDAYRKGDFLAAAQSYEAAALSYTASDDDLAAAEMLNNSCVAYLQAGNAQAAMRVVDETAATFARARDLGRQGMALGNLGAALEALNRPDEALDVYWQSSELLKQAGEFELRANVMQSISSLQLRTGKQLQALATMQAGLDGITHPNPKQRILKKLLQVPSKFLNKA
jgi:tetratricopeptide (TPR) repeat protein